jgi:hypothetical protein
MLVIRHRPSQEALMRLAVPDLVSNSYFPAIAAVELGFMREEGLDVELDLLFPVTDAVAALRDGAIDFLAGSAHAPVYADPGWQDVQLLPRWPATCTGSWLCGPTSMSSGPR